MVTRLRSLTIVFVGGVRDGKRSRLCFPSEIAVLPVQQNELEVIVFGTGGYGGDSSWTVGRCSFFATLTY